MLIDCLWDGRPPRSARANLHSYVTQLRRLLGDDRLESTPDGYRMRVEEGDLDAEVFERLVASAHGTAARDVLRTALDLWRGDVLAGTELPAGVQPLASRLDELRLTATEDWIDASMRAEDPPDLVAELVRLTGAHPLRERFQAQLLLALHRAGRTPEALSGYRRFRDRLVDELGVEPGPLLQRLHRDILAGGAGLSRPGAAGVEPTPPGRLGTGHEPPAHGGRAAPRTLRSEVDRSAEGAKGQLKRAPAGEVVTGSFDRASDSRPTRRDSSACRCASAPVASSNARPHFLAGAPSTRSRMPDECLKVADASVCRTSSIRPP